MLKLGFVSAIVPELMLAEVASLAKQIGYDCVEVMCWPKSKAERRYAGITHLDVTQFGPREAEETHAIMQKEGVAISALGYYPNPLSPVGDEAATSQQHLLKLIDAAALLGLSTINTFIGRDWHKSIEENWPTFLKVWKPIVAHAESKGIRIGIENCPMSFSADEWPGGKNLATSPAIWRRMFEEIGSPNLGLNYDPSHMVLQGMDYLLPLRDFKDRLFHIHAKDMRIDRHRLDDVGYFAHPGLFHTPKLPGMGEVDWGKFFSVLTDSRYQGPVCVEVEDRAFEGSLESRKLALKQSHTYLRNFVPTAV